MVSTLRYPDNSPAEWVTKELVAPTLSNRLYLFAYELYANQRSMDLGDKPFVLHGHRAQIRTNHQRIRRGASDGWMHISGQEVLLNDVDDFLENSDDAYRWAVRTPLLWTDDRGRSLAPFIFPTYSGVDEALDPQWQRERFTKPVADQVLEIIERQKLSTERNRLEGDKRGTTLNLQVGAGADDGYTYDAATFSSTDTRTIAGQVVTRIYRSWFRVTGVSGMSGSTVDAMSCQIYGNDPAGTGLTKIYAEDAEAPAAPTTAAQHETDRSNGTTAKIDWDAAIINNTWHTSPEMKTVGQEIVDGGFDPSAFLILHDDDGSANGVHMRYDTYEGSTTEAPKVDVTYTAGGGLSIPIVMHHRKMIGVS